MTDRRSFLLAVAGAPALLAAESDPSRDIFRRVNDIRTVHGLQPLEWAEDVARCAREHCDRKVELRFPGHEDPQRGGVSERLTRAGIHWMNCAENVFQMNGYEEIASFSVVFWWYSPGHQRNMISEIYRKTGVGVAQAEDGTWYATQIFLT